METGRLLNEREDSFTGRLSQKPILVGCTAGALIFLLLVGYLSYFDLQPIPQFAVAVTKSDDYTEAATSVVYPAQTKVLADSSGDYRVLGAGARIKAIGPIGVKVYAVALYVETKGARAALKAFQGKSPSAVANDKSFFDVLEKGAFNKMVELRMKRSVDRDTMVDAICEALEPRMKARDPQRADVLVEQFKALFTGIMKRAPVSKGLRSQYWLNFLILVGGFLIVAISLTFLFNMSGALKDHGADYKPDQGGNFSRNPVDEEAPVTDHRTDEELPPEGDLESKPIDEGFLPSGFDESSCVSRYDPLLLRKATLRTSSQHLKSALRKYETRHKRCAPYTEAYNKTVAVLGSSDATMTSECKFNIWFPTGGLGNRILSLTSSFLYALLTDRVLLIDTDEGFSDLFCEPFPGGSWLLPLDFPLRERFKDFKKHSNDSFGELLRNNLIGNPTNSKPQPYLYAHVYSDYGDLDKRFYCDEEQSYVKDVPWTIMMSNVYFAPAFFTMPMFKQELDDMFPDKGTVFHFLGRYLFHPSNEVWGLVRRFHEAYLSEFDVKVGLQIRVFHHEEGIPFVNVMDEILSCTMNEGLLPRLHDQEQQPSSNRTTKNSNKKKIAVLMTSLTRQFFEPLRRLFWQNATVTGESVAIHQPSFDEHQHTGDRDHDQRALAEIYLLSLTDKLVTSAASTFGYVAQGLGGLTPLMIPKSMNRTIQPCRRLLSMEPCFHMPPYYDCKTHQRSNTSVVEPYLLQCEDLAVGVKLVGDHTSTSTLSNPS